MSREELIALVVQLREANATLEERVWRLERLISRNSGNSSMPPSADDLPGRTKPAVKGAKGFGAQARQAAGRQGQRAGLGGGAG